MLKVTSTPSNTWGCSLAIVCPFEEKHSILGFDGYRWIILMDIDGIKPSSSF